MFYLEQIQAEDVKTLFDVIQELERAGLSDQEIADRFDTRDFEEANILIWALNDTNAHRRNILVYPKRIDPIGNEIFGLKKIDRELSLRKNGPLHNALSHLPNAKRPLSAEGITKIEDLDVRDFSHQLFGEELDAQLEKRLNFLKKLARQPGITLYQINIEMIRFVCRWQN